MSCHVLIAFVWVHKLFSLTCRHIQSERVYAPSTGKQKEKFALQFNKTFSMVVFTLLVSSVISAFPSLILVCSLIAFHQPRQGSRAHHMDLSVCCMKPKPSPLPSDLKRETQTGLIFSLVLLEPMMTNYYSQIQFSYAHNLMTT